MNNLVLSLEKALLKDYRKQKHGTWPLSVKSVVQGTIIHGHEPQVILIIEMIIKDFKATCSNTLNTLTIFHRVSLEAG